MKPRLKRFLSISVVILGACVLAAAQSQPRMISIGDRRLAVYCEGEATRSPTVILISAGGSGEGLG